MIALHILIIRRMVDAITRKIMALLTNSSLMSHLISRKIVIAINNRFIAAINQLIPKNISTEGENVFEFEFSPMLAIRSSSFVFKY